MDLRILLGLVAKERLQVMIGPMSPRKGRRVFLNLPGLVMRQTLEHCSKPAFSRKALIHLLDGLKKVLCRCQVKEFHANGTHHFIWSQFPDLRFAEQLVLATIGDPGQLIPSGGNLGAVDGIEVREVNDPGHGVVFGARVDKVDED